MPHSDNLIYEELLGSRVGRERREQGAIAAPLKGRGACFELGAPLYVPATTRGLLDIARRAKFPHLKSAIFCTEDSVLAADLGSALRNIEIMLAGTESGNGLRRFIRVRSPQVLRQCLNMQGIDQIDGWVFPKITPSTLMQYLGVLAREPRYALMLTLETREVFQATVMDELRDLITRPEIFESVIALRIGGNDLLNLLGIRRQLGGTIYATPLSHAIARLVCIFKPFGFNLSAPVFEYLERNEALEREVRRDVMNGLLPKAAIHPDQVPFIERNYRVSRDDLAAAQIVLDEDMPAVFRLHDFMCEPTTHSRWAETILARADAFGVN